MSHALKNLAESRGFQNAVIGVIFVSVLLMGLESYPAVAERYGPLLTLLERVAVGLFSLEIAIRVGAYGRRPWEFFSDVWNLFDFLIVAVCFLPESQFMAVLRLVRVLRVLRLLATVQAREIERLKNIELREAYRRLEEEKAESERLLLNILPLLVAQRLKGGAQIIADSYPDATVLFADIVGFTRLSSQITPEQLVSMLDDIFCRFDRLVEKYRVEKIKTIGDAYMVVAGLPEARPDHAEAVAELALEMLQALQSFNQDTGHTLHLRIGFHSGPVVAGVIGKKKFIYDLWGDTVNLASRMESQGLPDKVQVTETVQARLQDHYRFSPRGSLEIKGRGQMPTYFLEGRAGDMADIA